MNKDIMKDDKVVEESAILDRLRDAEQRLVGRLRELCVNDKVVSKAWQDLNYELGNLTMALRSRPTTPLLTKPTTDIDELRKAFEKEFVAEIRSGGGEITVSMAWDFFLPYLKGLR